MPPLKIKKMFTCFFLLLIVVGIAKARKSNGRFLFRTFSFPYFYYTMGLNFRVQNFSKKIDGFLIFSFSSLILKELKICIKIDKNMKFYVFCYKTTGQKSAKNSLFFSLIFVPKCRKSNDR